MQVLWYAILAGMGAVYVVLDGFDLGAGILHLVVAKTDEERRTVLAAIGPVWDGNEVWLIAGGGVLFFAFPRVYSAGFSGFYLPLMMVLWLLVLRGLSIEFRSKEENALWHSFWDGTFVFSSSLLAIIMGAALGNVVRGVPLDDRGFFHTPLFINFLLSRNPGILDWFTVLLGLFTFLVLAGHAAHYLIWKTIGGVHNRCRALSGRIWTAVAVLGVMATVVTVLVQPALFDQLFARPWAWPLVALIPASLAGVFYFDRQKQERNAFLASSAFIVSLLASTAAGFYPNLLISTLSPAYNLSTSNASNSALGLNLGVYIWLPAIVLAIGYFTYLFRSFSGKVSVGRDGYGH